MKPCTDLMVLAGGFGTRLKAAIGDEVPKPLAPIAGRPFIHYLIESWLRQGVTRLTFLLHHQAGHIERYLQQLQAEGGLAGCEVRTVTEPVPLGTGGAVGHAIRHFQIKDPLLVANADTWLGSGIGAIGTTPAPAIAVLRISDTERYGSVQVTDGRVGAFLEKQGSQGSGWINAGLYHLHPELFRGRPAGAYSLERDIFPGLAAAGQLRAAPLDVAFIDIGIPADYHRFHRWVEEGRKTKL